MLVIMIRVLVVVNTWVAFVLTLEVLLAISVIRLAKLTGTPESSLVDC